MNAYEIADELDGRLDHKAANMLRQQAERIAELENESTFWKNLYKDLCNVIEEYKKLTPQTNDGCGNCHACLVGVEENGFPITSQRMILCPDCGNKRCPKASNHRHQCTDSNEPNQRGSIYTTPQTKPLSDEEIIKIRQATKAKSTENWADTLAFARAIEEAHGIK